MLTSVLRILVRAFARSLALCAGVTITVLILNCQSPARWKPEYAQADPAVRDWYATRTLTPEAQKRFPFTSCCDHSDVVKTRFMVNRTDGGDEWFWLDDGKWRRIPPDIVHTDEHAPSGRGVLFIYEDEPTCFFPPGGGI
jgi:hypothetical protein